jgi:hypothetical protein
MRSEPIALLTAMYASRGDRIVRDPELCNALLTDGCPECRKEIAILMNTIRCGAAQELLGSTAPYQSLRARLIQKVQDEQGLTPEAASWGVDTWREALSGSAPQPELQDTPSRAPRAERKDTPPQAPQTERKKNWWRWLHDTTEAEALAEPDEIARAWRSGQKTNNTRQAVSYVRRCVSGSVSGRSMPNEIQEMLRKRGIADDVAEQLMLKCAPFAGLASFAGAIGALFLWVLWTAGNGNGAARACLFVLFVAGLIWGVIARWKWRQWIKSLAMRKTRAA